jgi:hypothetical protein
MPSIIDDAANFWKSSERVDAGLDRGEHIRGTGRTSFNQVSADAFKVA